MFVMRQVSRIPLLILSFPLLLMLQGCGLIDDLKTQSVKTRMVTVGRPSEQGDANSIQPDLSAAGRFVVFTSDSTNLVNEEATATRGVFMKDTTTGETIRISSSSEGKAADDDSEHPAISADGGYVVFQSVATNLTDEHPEDGGCTSPAGLDVSCPSIYLKDMASGTTELVSRSSNGAIADGYNERPAISGNGRYIAFRSTATNLAPGTEDDVAQIYRRDLQTGFTELVSSDSEGVAGDASSDLPAISDDGRFVAFKSMAFNLVSGDDIGSDVFVKDLDTGQLTLASTDSDGSPGNGASGFAALDISGDGLFVAFESEADNLDTSDDNFTRDVFIKDLQTGETSLISADKEGIVGDDATYASVSLSRDGALVVFVSNANNLTQGDTVNKTDVFLKDRTTGAVVMLSTSETGEPGNAPSEIAAIAADGVSVAFVSSANNLVPEDTNGKDDIFVRKLASGEVRLVSTSSSPQETYFFGR